MSFDSASSWWNESDLERPDRDTMEVVAWTLAIGFYGVGDLVSTLLGLRAGATESNPLPAALVDAAPGLMTAAVVLTLLKLLVLVVLVLLTRTLPVRYRIAVPATLAVIGIVVVAWNTTVVVALYT